MVKLYIFLLFVAIARLASVKSQNTTYPTSCGTFDCGFTGKKVWSIVNGKCRHWPNQCQFDSENCIRQKQDKQALVANTQETCIKHCRKYCSKIYRPVCASFWTEHQGAINIKKVTFANYCLFNNHVCRNGSSFGVSTQEGVCDPNVVNSL